MGGGGWEKWNAALRPSATVATTMATTIDYECDSDYDHDCMAMTAPSLLRTAGKRACGAESCRALPPRW